MILDEIVESKRDEIEALRGRRAELEDRAAAAPAARSLTDALRGGDEISVVAEFKRRSPSAGDLARGAEPVPVARGYREAGASALSVLTDGPWFGGALEDLSDVRASVDLPVLRKDFLVDPIQVVEARAAGADGVLLIARVLEGPRLGEMLRACADAGMDALVEVHGADELDRALEAGARIVGVNARDLDTFAVDLALSERLVGAVPGDRVAVAESGIRGGGDVRRMGEAGADAVLVGGWLMERGPGAVAELCGVPRRGRPAPEGAA